MLIILNISWTLPHQRQGSVPFQSFQFHTYSQLLFEISTLGNCSLATAHNGTTTVSHSRHRLDMYPMLITSHSFTVWTPQLVHWNSSEETCLDNAPVSVKTFAQGSLSLNTLWPLGIQPPASVSSGFASTKILKLSLKDCIFEDMPEIHPLEVKLPPETPCRWTVHRDSFFFFSFFYTGNSS